MWTLRNITIVKKKKRKEPFIKCRMKDLGTTSKASSEHNAFQ
jgi:hypothetical protein